MSAFLDLFEPFAIVVLVLFGGVQLLLAAAAARLPLRIWRLPERGAGQLKEEDAQFHGQLVPLDAPLRTLEGEPVVLLETSLLSPSKRDIPLSEKRWGRLAVSDSTGSAEIDLDQVILWRDSRRATLDAERFRSLFPSLWSDCDDWQQRAASFVVEQSYVPAGQAAFVAGRVMPETGTPGHSYRRTSSPKLVIAASVGMPLVVACRPRGNVLSHLLAPAARHALAGLAALALAAIVFGLDRWISAAAGF